MKELNPALALDPMLAEAHHVRGKVLSSLNRHAEAIESERKAMELSPFARPYGLALTFNKARQYDAAISEARARLESAPNDVVLLWMLEDAYRCKGMYSETVRTAEPALQASNVSTAASAIAKAYRHDGYRGVSQFWLNYWNDRKKQRYVSPLQLADLTAALQQREETLALLQQGYDEKSPRLVDLQFDPAYDFLHSDERYRAIVRKVGLPPAY